MRGIPPPGFISPAHYSHGFLVCGSPVWWTWHFTAEKRRDVWMLPGPFTAGQQRPSRPPRGQSPGGLDQATDGPLPLSEFLSGSTQGVLYENRFYGCGPNTWTRKRKAARRLHVKIDVSSGSSLSKVIADDVSCLSTKAIRGFRTVIRRRWTTEFSNASNKGRVARGLLLDSSRDIARLKSSRTKLNFEEWKLLHRSRLPIPPLLGIPGISAPNNRYRWCRADAPHHQTTSHVISHCRVDLPEIGHRHYTILEELARTIRRSGHTVRVNQVFPDTTLRPDIVNTSVHHRLDDPV